MDDFKKLIDGILGFFAKRYTTDYIASHLSDTHYSKLSDSRRKRIIKDEKNRFSNVVSAFALIMYAVFALLVIGSFILYFFFGFGFVIFVIGAIVGALAWVAGYYTNEFAGKVYELGDEVFLPIAAKKAFPAEYRYFKKHGVSDDFVPTKTLNIAAMGTADTTAILIDERSRMLALSGEEVADDSPLSFKSIVGYRVTENGKTVFISRRGSEPDGVEYFGLCEAAESHSKDDGDDTEAITAANDIAVYVSYTYGEDDEFEAKLQYLTGELSRDSYEYKKANERLLSIVRELEFVVNKTRKLCDL